MVPCLFVCLFICLSLCPDRIPNYRGSPTGSPLVIEVPLKSIQGCSDMLSRNVSILNGRGLFHVAPPTSSEHKAILNFNENSNEVNLPLRRPQSPDLKPEECSQWIDLYHHHHHHHHHHRISLPVEEKHDENLRDDTNGLLTGFCSKPPH